MVERSDNRHGRSGHPFELRRRRNMPGKASRTACPRLRSIKWDGRAEAFRRPMPP